MRPAPTRRCTLQTTMASRRSQRHLTPASSAVRESCPPGRTPVRQAPIQRARRATKGRLALVQQGRRPPSRTPAAQDLVAQAPVADPLDPKRLTSEDLAAQDLAVQDLAAQDREGSRAVDLPAPGPQTSEDRGRRAHREDPGPAEAAARVQAAEAAHARRRIHSSITKQRVQPRRGSARRPKKAGVLRNCLL
jgi:hypothetical protein